MLAQKPRAPSATALSSRVFPGSSMNSPATTVAIVTRMDIGNIRRARRAQKLRKSIELRSPASSMSSWVIRNPEMTKNTSTPMYPPENQGTPAWFSTTSPTASARIPSISVRRVFTGETLPIGTTLCEWTTYKLQCSAWVASGEPSACFGH